MIECRIPVSPRPAFLNRLRLTVESIRQFYPDAIFTVSCYPLIESPWPDVTFRGPSAKEFDRWKGTRAEYLATMMDRYRPPFHGDHMLFLDADVICTGRLDDLFGFDGIQGVQAHVAPVSQMAWHRLFFDFGIDVVSMHHTYSGQGVMGQFELGPFYPNSGVVFGPRASFEAIASRYDDAIEFLRVNVSDAYWFDQLGLALACAGHSVRELPLRYNFPNQAAFDAWCPLELRAVRFLHYLRTDVVDRDRDFADIAAIRRLVARTDLTGSNEVLRRRVAELLPVAFPAPADLACAEDAPHA